MITNKNTMIDKAVHKMIGHTNTSNTIQAKHQHNNIKKKITIPKSVRKQALTELRKKALLEDVQFIGTLAQCMENRWRNNLFDVNLDKSKLISANSQVYRGTDALKSALSERFNVKEPDELEYGMCTAMDRVIRFFCVKPCGLVNHLMDQLDEVEREVEKKAKEMKGEASND